jgi:TetR/AcrR family transcriptional regulator, regulator of cefoperazone and chloramphenicol sensitivity
MSRPATSAALEGTRAALIAAGIHFFGSKGFAATSTRELAARANTNIASIAYHFGGKDGLRLACGEDFARRLTAVVAGAPPPAGTTAAAARLELHAVFTRMIQFLLGQSEAAGAAAFLLRELTENSPIIDLIYTAFMEPAHKRVCGLWGLACGQDPESAGVRLAVFSFVGQILYFRISSAIVTRRMGWGTMGQVQVDQIATTLLANLDAMLGVPGKV